MTKTITLPDEATIRGIIDGSVTVIVLPVEPQPPSGTEAMRDIPETDRWWSAIKIDNEIGVGYVPIQMAMSEKQHQWHSPFGQPGDVVELEWKHGETTIRCRRRTKAVRCCQASEVTEWEFLNSNDEWVGKPDEMWVWVAEVERLEGDDGE